MKKNKQYVSKEGDKLDKKTLETLRKEQNMSQRELAEKLNVSAGARFRDQPLYRKNVCKEFCPEKTKETADACDAPGRNLSRTEEHIEPA